MISASPRIRPSPTAPPDASPGFGSGRAAGDGPLGEVTNEGWQFTLRLNLDSLFYSNRAAVRQLLQQGRLAMAGATIAAHVIGSVAMTLLGIGSYALATRV